MVFTGLSHQPEFILCRLENRFTYFNIGLYRGMCKPSDEHVYLEGVIRGNKHF